MNIQFRIHRAWCDVSGVMVSLLEKCEKGFVFQHEQDEEVARTHVHGYMFDTTVSRKTLSEQISKKLNLKGNTDFQTSDKCGRKDPRPIDLSGAWVYGSKFATTEVSYTKNISTELLDELQACASNWTFHKIASKSAPTSELVVLKEIKVKTKPTQYQHVTEVVKLINDVHPDLISKPFSEKRRCIFEVTYKYFQDQQLFMGKFKQLDFLDMVLMKWGCSEYKNILFADFTRRTSNSIL